MRTSSKLLISCLVLAVLVAGVYADQTSDSLMQKASDLMKSKNYTGALEAFNQSIQLNPDDAGAWNGKGYALNLLNRNSEAMDAINQSIKLDPNLTQAWNSKASLLMKTGHTKEALEALNKTIELDPKNKFATETLAKINSGKKSP